MSAPSGHHLPGTFTRNWTNDYQSFEEHSHNNSAGAMVDQTYFHFNNKCWLTSNATKTLSSSTQIKASVQADDYCPTTLMTPSTTTSGIVESTRDLQNGKRTHQPSASNTRSHAESPPLLALFRRTSRPSFDTIFERTWIRSGTSTYSTRFTKNQ